jgi:hypothetical protein
MLGSWLNRYALLMARTLVVSRAGSFAMLVIALSDEVAVLNAISMSEGLADETIVRVVVPPIVYTAVFGLRFGLLMFTSPAWLVGASWWLVAAAIMISSELFQAPARENGSPFSAYEPLNEYTLESAGYLFIALSGARFIVTALAAFSNEFDPDRR